MTAPEDVRARARRTLITEESVYGLILVSGMIVVSNSLVGTSLNALISVFVTVVVFFAAHVYAGTIARLAIGGTQARLRPSIAAAIRHSQGMLLASVIPLVVLLLGVSHLIDDDVAIWAALLVDTLLLGVLGWLAVAHWTSKFWVRLTSALTTAAFGAIIVLLKALIHH
ncbi:hypothetical protein [Microbacterium sp.]|uniref:hypothetical protein n=1 Tax=Microbacterium sp. TaxID=51671 RepID=UPI0039E27A18